MASENHAIISSKSLQRDPGQHHLVIVIDAVGLPLAIYRAPRVSKELPRYLESKESP